MFVDFGCILDLCGIEEDGDWILIWLMICYVEVKVSLLVDKYLLLVREVYGYVVYFMICNWGMFGGNFLYVDLVLEMFCVMIVLDVYFVL